MIQPSAQSSVVFTLHRSELEAHWAGGSGCVAGLSSAQPLSLSLSPAQTAAWRKQIFQQLSDRTKRELENFRHYEQAIEQVSGEDTYLLSAKHIYWYWASVILLYSCPYVCLWQLLWIITVWDPCGKPGSYQTGSSSLYLKAVTDSSVWEQTKRWSALSEALKPQFHREMFVTVEYCMNYSTARWDFLIETVTQVDELSLSVTIKGLM